MDQEHRTAGWLLHVQDSLNRSWAENYGAFGTFDGPNHELHHDGGTVTIRYDHRTRDITIN